ncbi:MAG: hypothetical protein GX417_08960 [Clostridiales bacterium]|nr:hypothetical protein [Clostridiales bacterium]
MVRIAGMLMGGPRAGLPPQVSELAKTKEKYADIPVIVASGANKNNVADLLAIGDGVIVGTNIKRDGVLWNEIDPARAEMLVKAATNH